MSEPASNGWRSPGHSRCSGSGTRKFAGDVIDAGTPRELTFSWEWAGDLGRFFGCSHASYVSDEHCGGCGETWPCDGVKLAQAEAELRALRAVADAAVGLLHIGQDSAVHLYRADREPWPGCPLCAALARL